MRNAERGKKQETGGPDRTHRTNTTDINDTTSQYYGHKTNMTDIRGVFSTGIHKLPDHTWKNNQLFS